MSVKRFENIRRMLRFDYKRTRPKRLKEDDLATFCHIWELFLANCQVNFTSNDCDTIDDQFVLLFFFFEIFNYKIRKMQLTMHGT